MQILAPSALIVNQSLPLPHGEILALSPMIVNACLPIPPGERAGAYVRLS
jgi:hypothetical protein